MASGFTPNYNNNGLTKAEIKHLDIFKKIGKKSLELKKIKYIKQKKIWYIKNQQLVDDIFFCLLDSLNTNGYILTLENDEFYSKFIDFIYKKSY